jgi:hypothetical protein
MKSVQALAAKGARFIAGKAEVVTPRIGEMVDADRPFASTAWWEAVR